MYGIPEVINSYNMYLNGNQLIGLSGEVSLPDFEPITETISGPGILGEYETTLPGMFNDMEIEIPFRTLVDDVFKLMNSNKVLDITLRGAMQVTNKSNGLSDQVGIRVVIRGKNKKLKSGSMQNGKAMDASVTVGILYILIEVDGKKKLELDKLNSVFIVDGVDLLKKVRALC